MAAAKDSHYWGQSAYRGHAAVCSQEERHPETGKTWKQMPGNDPETKRLNFFLYRRGMLQMRVRARRA